MKPNEQMEELNVAQIISKYNLIIPEIQREYVWGNNDFDILDLFFTDIIESSKQESNDKIEELKKELLQKVSHGDFNSINFLKDEIDKLQTFNIGFLYSYRPGYFVYNDVSDDVYLIDGQQRFTTLVLSLLFFALRENKKDYLMEILRFNPKKEKIAFDYRVRSQTHNFLIDLFSLTSSL
jgi:uncharacterized protein with ParB-like and HNH nuclease domain